MEQRTTDFIFKHMMFKYVEQQWFTAENFLTQGLVNMIFIVLW